MEIERLLLHIIRAVISGWTTVLSFIDSFTCHVRGIAAKNLDLVIEGDAS